MTEETVKTPEWMLLLENKKKRPHRLAHEIGAGAPCLSCGDSCPGLDLHFWRKLCRNCKCKKEEHDVKDDEGYEQFEILFANAGVGKKKRKGALLNIKVPDTSASTVSSAGNVKNASNATKQDVAFDWIPPDVPEDIAAEYMQQLPPSKLPISGSDGALYRRQQLENQIPLHDLDATKCHGLTTDEIKELQHYLENIKNNVVGQGRVTKLPVLYKEQRLPCEGPNLHQSKTVACSSLTGESRPIRIASSQSAQCLKSLPSFPLPKPFTMQHHNKDAPDDLPPPPPDMLLPGALNVGLKTPSAFFPTSFQNQGRPIDAQIVADQQPHNTAYSTQIPLNNIQNPNAIASALGDIVKDQYKQNTQSSVQVPGKHYDPSIAKQGISSLGGGVKAQNHASDGTFMSDQQAHDIAYSTRVPLGLISQQSKSLNISKDASGSSKSKQPLMNPETTQDLQLSKDASTVPGDEGQHLQHGGNSVNVSHDGAQNFVPGTYPLSSPKDNNFVQSNPAYDSINNNAPFDGENFVLPSYPELSNTGLPQDAKFIPYSTNISGQVYSESIGGDSMPKSAHILHQSNLIQQEDWEADTVENELSGKLEQLMGVCDPSLHPNESHIKCHTCKEGLLPGQVAVLAERAGEQAAWHPQCFVCCTCEELLVDLIYFYHKGDVYCGRHYADLLKIPRCFACDELIFVKEYTCAEEKAFHVKHFCCYECDTPLGGKQYIPKDNQPVCLQCFENKYGKTCHTCKIKIAAGDQRVGWKDLSWHVSASCFRCSRCLRSLLGGKFLVKNEQPFCSKECAQAAIGC